LRDSIDLGISNQLMPVRKGHQIKMTVKTIKQNQINGIAKGDTVKCFTYAEERSVTGVVTAVNRFHTVGYWKHSDYASITVDVDGMPYEFGTGGHLGETWTTESGATQWFVEADRSYLWK
jgi:hypothetical protein